ARADSNDTFAAFEEELRSQARAALTNPNRLITIPHLTNSIASRLKLQPATSCLIEGYVLQWIAIGRLSRLITVSRGLTPYQAIFWRALDQDVSLALAEILNAVVNQEYLTLQNATEFIPNSLLFKPQHVEILFGHLLYLGHVSTDVAPGTAIDSI